MHRAVLIATVLCTPALLLGQAVTAPVTYQWTGSARDGDFSNPSNWLDGLAPTNDGSAIASFQNTSSPPSILLTGMTDLGSLSLNNTVLDFAANASADLTLESGFNFNQTYSSTSFGYNVGVHLPGTQSIALDYAYLTFNGPVDGGDVSVSTSYGSVTFNGSASFSSYSQQGGGINLSSGQALVGTPLSLGDLYVDIYAPTTFTAPVTLAGTITAYLGYEDPVDFAGFVTLSGESVQITSGYYTGQTAITFSGGIGEQPDSGTLLTFGHGLYELSGTNTYSAGTVIGTNYSYVASDYATYVTFDNPGAVPASGTILVNPDGSAGVRDADTLAALLDHLDTNSSGTLAFEATYQDTSVILVPASTTGLEIPYVQDSTLDLTGFAGPISIGTSSHAIFDAPVLMNGPLRFGLGTGILEYNAGLSTTDSSTGVSLVVESYSDMTVYLRGENTTGGDIRVDGGRLIFDYDGAIPKTDVPVVGVAASAYVGVTANTGLTPSGLFGLITAESTGTVGFDESNGETPYIQDTIDFSQLGSSVFVGTATSAVLQGAILPGDDATLRFAAKNYGGLTIESALSGDVSVEFGSPSYDYRSGTIYLPNANTYTGGTVLNNGSLALGDAASLGTGPLTVTGMGYGTLSAMTGGLNFAFDINLQNYPELDFNVNNDFTLSGVISGQGSFYVYGSGKLTLSGANQLTNGDIYIYDTTDVEVSNDLALANVVLDFENAASVHFLTDHPTVAGLSDYYNYSNTPGSVSIDSAQGTLSIQSSYEHDFSGIISGPGALRILPAPNGQTIATQVLSGANTYSGGTSVEGAYLIAANNSALGTGTVSVTGPGMLGTAAGVTISNPLLVSSGGTLAGRGTFAPGSPLVISDGRISPGDPVSGSQETLSPAGAQYSFNFIGNLTLGTDVTFSSGGVYSWEIADALGTAGSSWDLLSISGQLVVDATEASPFIITISTDPNYYYNGISDFDPEQAYSWVILHADGAILGFDPAAFKLDASAFTNSTGIGSFYLSQSGNDLVLNFTPVPEPSTWLLLGLGGSLVAYAARRHRR